MKPVSSTINDELINFDIEKIRRFTSTELAKLSNNPLPFCYQIGIDTLIIGKYKVLKVNDKCWQVTQSGEKIFDFFTRKNAIFYCIAMHKKKYHVADDIRKNDWLLNTLDFDATLYRYRYRVAQEQNDYWNIVLFSNRYTETIAQLDTVKKQLKKSLNLAK